MDWDFGGLLGLALEDDDVKAGKCPAAPFVEHKEVKIKAPKSSKSRLGVAGGKVNYASKWKAYFDGGCSKG